MGDSWRASGFLSSYFVLVGTHGLHILIGLLWMIVLGLIIIKKGLTAKSMKGLVMFNLFWHFLDVIWIFIFSVVYLMGHMGL
jgi:cytochrome o ubiquinol oxidase subunit 3